MLQIHVPSNMLSASTLYFKDLSLHNKTTVIHRAHTTDVYAIFYVDCSGTLEEAVLSSSTRWLLIQHVVRLITRE